MGEAESEGENTSVEVGSRPSPSEKRRLVEKQAPKPTKEEQDGAMNYKPF